MRQFICCFIFVVAATCRAAPPQSARDLRPAFNAYVRGFEEGLALLKAGQDSASADVKISAAHRELVEIARRYE